MRYLIEQLVLDCDYTAEDLRAAVADELDVSEEEIKSVTLLREAVDARKKPRLKMVVNAAATLVEGAEVRRGTEIADSSYFEGLNYERLQLAPNAVRPVVVGFGPAGMFAALVLAKSGLRPIVIEQGKAIDERKIDIDKFWSGSEAPNLYSNVQFGEGGAGAFSDGKLQSSLDTPICKKIINELVLHGAPPEIAYKSKPHIGSDNLPRVVQSIRNQIIDLGGEVRFNTRLKDIDFESRNAKKRITGCEVENVTDNAVSHIDTDIIMLCTGHSAKDIFNLLYSRGVMLGQKAFALGVRIEHPQSRINEIQFGEDFADIISGAEEHENAEIIRERLGAADYKIAVHLDNDRSLFTFCMCPGGEIVNAANEAQSLVVNGMSNFARAGKYANSALLVNIHPADFGSNHPLAGLHFQEKYERAAFELGGGNNCAPAQTVGEFCGEDDEEGGGAGEVAQSTIKNGIKFADLSQCLPDFVYETIKEGIPQINKRLKNFAMPNDLLVGVETRSSSAVRIVRHENFESVSCEKLFACGEGAGHAGGIISSAQDGARAAEALLKYFK